MFKDWLSHIGAGQFTSKFISAGYDLPFIAKHGITDADLDCVGVPKTMMGIRRKIQQLHHLDKFYEQEEDDEEDDEDEDEDDEEDDEEDDD